MTSAQSPNAANGVAAQPPATEDLSRMEGEYGAKMIGKLKQQDVLIIGMTGLGCETAKNLLLAGPHSVTLHDDNLMQPADLGANFYATQQSIGQPRASQMMSAMGELNPNVSLKLHTGAIRAADLCAFDVVVVCDGLATAKSFTTLCEWNAACRSNKKGDAQSATVFLWSQMSGTVCHVFSDFGPAHACFDADGAAVRNIIVDYISRAEHGVITVDGDRHLLHAGDQIKLEEVHGMDKSADAMIDENEQEIVFANDAIVTRINAIHTIGTTKNPKKFTIGDTRHLAEYTSGGVGVQIKQSLLIQHNSMQNELSKPTLCTGYMDFTKFGRDLQLHLCMMAAEEFHSKHKRTIGLHSQKDANELLNIAKSLLTKQQEKFANDQHFQWHNLEIDTKVLQQYALYAATELSPLCALFGGIVAQEITKQCGKYTPLTQWLHFDAMELLPAEVPKQVSPSSPTHARYQHLYSVFGTEFVAALQRQRVFLVGCGALGCEYLKLFALLGLGCGGDATKQGNVTLTDDDRIELSNLSRQFLFRRKHVGHAKSTSAATAVLSMNPALSGQHLSALETRVEPKTESTFDDQFWDGLDFVVNALDNATARNYVDSKCVLHSKPLFESGTLGTQANSVICLPGLTPSYKEGAVAGEDQGIAKCTLRNFPSDIVHCIEWSREKFDDLFVSGADAANSFLEDPNAYLEKLKQEPLTRRDALQTVLQWLKLARAPTFEQCVRVVHDEFIAHFRNAIKDLTHHFPQDARMREPSTGVDLGPFWHGHKRFPQCCEFVDVRQPMHLDYLSHGANILASVLGLKEESRESVASIASSITTPSWSYSGATVDVDEKKTAEQHKAEAEEKQLSQEDSVVIQRLESELLALDLKQFHKLHPAEFEKDVDSNHHIDWITAASNLRAHNYQLKPATRNKVRLTAGKIIPAIATTTAAITGFIGIEILKHIAKVKLVDYRAASINLATNVFCCENLPDPIYRKSGMDPQTYMQVVAIPEKHTCWDKIVILGSKQMTLAEFMAEFKRVHHQCELDMLATPTGTVFYNSIDALQPNRQAIVDKRLATPLVALFQELVGPIVPESRKYLLFDCSVETEGGDPGITPAIQFFFE